MVASSIGDELNTKDIDSKNMAMTTPKILNASAMCILVCT